MESGNSIQNCPPIQPIDSIELNTPITTDETIIVLYQAPTNKALEIDNIDPSYLDHDSVIEFLLSFLNFYHCLLQGGCPAAWRKTLIFPIHRSGHLNRSDPISYRGISLQSIVLKPYTYILN